MNEDQLDALLSQPLAPVADNGFSARVIARVKFEERRHDVVALAAAGAVALVLCLLVPVHNILGDLLAVLLQLSMTPMIGVAAALLMLTFLIDRVLWDRKLFQI